MISSDQALLSNEIKSVHLWLRKRSKEVGFEQAWQEHLDRKDILNNYAKSMKLLAENYWDKINQGERQKYCRIYWICTEIDKYFLSGGYHLYVEKEAVKFQLCNPLFSNYEPSQPIKLLDVGSCYNPFQKFDWIETYAVDLCPADINVKKCNFLDVAVIDFNTDWWAVEEVASLPQSWFQVVTFSLFLEYLPGEEQRNKACQTAWQILQPNGLLIIVTPDSKHSTANAQLMKSWKFALLKMGFVRITLDKLPYLYCMTFRKTLNVSKYLETTKTDSGSLAIPQDFVNYSVESVPNAPLKVDRNDLLDGFLELPFGI